MSRHIILFLLCCYLNGINFVKGDCTISTNQDITNPQVLILRPEGGDGNNAFFMPDVGGDVVKISNGQIVHLSCGIRNFRIDGVNTGVQSVNATCAGTAFNINGENVHFSAVSCSQYPVHSFRFTGKTCLGEHREFEIGYEVNARFITLMTGCFDSTMQTTLYVAAEVPPNIEGSQVNFPRPAWAGPDDAFNLGGVEIDTLYTRNSQRIAINKLLGLEESSTKYVHETNNYYLARGHLAAKADFVYGTQQRATFYLINAAPQWQMFNQANWLTLEDNIRRYIVNSGKAHIIYTGSYGVSTLPHEQTGENVDLYLYVDNNNNKAVPVPRLFYRILYEPTSKAGIVFLGVNNPYFFDEVEDVICPDVCSQVNWLTWTPTDIVRGYCYCCSVDAFRSATGFSIDIQVSGLLT